MTNVVVYLHLHRMSKYSQLRSKYGRRRLMHTFQRVKPIVVNQTDAEECPQVLIPTMSMETSKRPMNCPSEEQIAAAQRRTLVAEFQRAYISKDLAQETY
jgi:hypothetical protein